MTTDNPKYEQFKAEMARNGREFILQLRGMGMNEQQFEEAFATAAETGYWMPICDEARRARKKERDLTDKIGQLDAENRWNHTQWTRERAAHGELHARIAELQRAVEAWKEVLKLERELCNGWVATKQQLINEWMGKAREQENRAEAAEQDLADANAQLDKFYNRERK